MRIVKTEQRSAPWLVWRGHGLGSSDAACVLGLSPWKTREQLLVEKVTLLSGGKVADRKNSAMERGKRLEPGILEWYASWFPAAEPLCAEHEEHAFLRASFDGYAAEDLAVVEAKAPNRLDHETALAGEVPDKYLPQCHHLLLVAGDHAQVLRYVSYSNYFPVGKQYAVVTVRPDPEPLQSLLEAELEFWKDVQGQLDKKTRK